MVNGNPAISYYDVTNGNLKYVRATDADGSAWETPVTVDNFGDAGRYTSIAVVNGNPAVGYFDQANWNLKYVRAADADGSSWSAPIVVDSDGMVGPDSNMMESIPAYGWNVKLNYYTVSGAGIRKHAWLDPGTSPGLQTK